MKPFRLVLFALIALIVFGTVADAQQFLRQDPNKIPGAFYYPIWTLQTYAASQKDTSSAYNVCGVRDLEAFIQYDDSVYCITRFEYRPTSGGTWAWVAGDTVNHTGGGVVSTSTVHERILRSTTINLMNFGGQMRVIQVFQATLCGVSTPTYTVQWRYKP